MRWKLCLHIALLFLIRFSSGKYIEGHLKTLEDWSFLARFCFISGRGQYEYEIEFEKRYGEPQLLLYFDEKTQWPAVYKTTKTCKQKISVLSTIGNQIVTLSARSPHADISGCRFKRFDEEKSTTPAWKYNNKNKPTTTKSPNNNDDLDSTYYDQFLKTSTDISNENTTDVDSELNSTNSYQSEILNSTNDQVNLKNSIDSGLSYRNQIENNTNYDMETEELFDKIIDSKNLTRIPRSLPPVFLSATSKSKIIVNCRSTSRFSGSRERWWYIAIANCGSQKGVDIKYRFRMTNGPQGDFWHEHFSADEMYIPPILLTECLAYTVLLLAIFLCAVELKARHLFHCTYRLFAFSAFIQWIGVLCDAVAWAKYAVTGLGPFTILGGIFMGASEISYLALMLLMAKGYTITRARLSTCTTVKLTVFINLYIVGFISLYIYQAEAFDPGEVLNLYESPAGFGLIGLRCSAWFAFLISIVTTLKKYPEKGAFYYPFTLCGSLWLVGGPMLTLVGIGVLDPWVRESVMCGAHAITAFGGHSAFLWLTWPSRANNSFPYHVRTNHVGIATDDDALDYPRHEYAPGPTVQDPNIIIPLSRHTEDLLSGVYNQYLRDREIFNSASTPISHISFPNSNTPTAPYTNSEIIQNPVNKLHHNSSTDIQNYREIIEQTDMNRNKIIEQNDSGHPSLENSANNSNSTSPPNEIELTSTRSPISGMIVAKNDVIEQNSGRTLKNNPFLISNNSSNSTNNRGPNKVILEPIEHPLRANNDNEIKLSGGTGDGVPKHLFAAKVKKEFS